MSRSRSGCPRKRGQKQKRNNKNDSQGVTTLKAAIKVLVQEHRNSVPGVIINKGHSSEKDGGVVRKEVWFDDLPQESIDSYDDLKKALLENYLQQKKCIKDPHSSEERWQPLTVNERSHSRYGNNKKLGKSRTSRRGASEINKDRNENRIEKRNASKFCEFHREVGHTTDECMHLKKQIEEMLKAGKISHLIKELKQNNGKEQPKVTKKGETLGKDNALAILMV
ncbi:hypothetical protein Tco_0688742 [Tanacetum coccineum]